MRPYLKKNLHKKGLVEWLKKKALGSNPSTAKKIFFNFITVLLLYCEYIVTFTKALTIYLSQIHPLHHFPLSPSLFLE
jgi:hypothetical protein